MTYREAFAQAQREFGDSEERVAEGMKFCAMMLPADASIDAQIERGKEREFIDTMVELRKSIVAIIQTDPQGFLDEYQKRMASRLEKN